MPKTGGGGRPRRRARGHALGRALGWRCDGTLRVLGRLRLRLGAMVAAAVRGSPAEARPRTIAASRGQAWPNRTGTALRTVEAGELERTVEIDTTWGLPCSVANACLFSLYFVAP